MRRWTDRQLAQQAELHRGISRRIGCNEDCLVCFTRVLVPAGACVCWHAWVYGGARVGTRSPEHARVCVRDPEPWMALESSRTTLEAS
jgi:hypothetical protein